MESVDKNEISSRMSVFEQRLEDMKKNSKEAPSTESYSQSSPLILLETDFRQFKQKVEHDMLQMKCEVDIVILE